MSRHPGHGAERRSCPNRSIDTHFHGPLRRDDLGFVRPNDHITLAAMFGVVRQHTEIYPPWSSSAARCARPRARPPPKALARTLDTPPGAPGQSGRKSTNRGRIRNHFQALRVPPLEHTWVGPLQAIRASGRAGLSSEKRLGRRALALMVPRGTRARGHDAERRVPVGPPTAEFDRQAATAPARAVACTEMRAGPGAAPAAAREHDH